MIEQGNPDGNPTPYSRLEAGHPCTYPNTEKRLFGTVMEDGQVALVIARANPADPTSVTLLEHIAISRDDFNQWMHVMRLWWTEEKRHPLARNRPAE